MPTEHNTGARDLAGRLEEWAAELERGAGASARYAADGPLRGMEAKRSRLYGRQAADIRSALAEIERLRGALSDFVDSAALIGNTANDLVPRKLALTGMEAWSRCLRNARAALQPTGEGA